MGFEEDCWVVCKIAKAGKYVRSLDENALEQNANQFMRILIRIQKIIETHIPDLKDYIPPEKTAYGIAKVSSQSLYANASSL